MKRYIDIPESLLSKAAGGQEMQPWRREGNLRVKTVKIRTMRNKKYVMDAETEAFYEINQILHEISTHGPHENLSCLCAIRRKRPGKKEDLKQLLTNRKDIEL